MLELVTHHCAGTFTSRKMASGSYVQHSGHRCTLQQTGASLPHYPELDLAAVRRGIRTDDEGVPQCGALSAARQTFRRASEEIATFATFAGRTRANGGKRSFAPVCVEVR
jgi:hypothetical protein